MIYSLMERGHRWLLVLCLSTHPWFSGVYAQASSLQAQRQPCGTWAVREMASSDADHGLKAFVVSGTLGDNCAGNFRLENETGIVGVGGYGLELSAFPGNSVAAWTDPWKPEGPAYLFPSLDGGIIVTPLNRSSEAVVTVQADVTVELFSVDLAFFLVRSMLSLMAGGCSPSEYQLTLMAIRISAISNTAANLTFSGNIVGAYQELGQIGNELIDRFRDMAQDLGIGCVITALSPTQKVAAIAQITTDYLTWVPKVLWDYAKYGGRSGRVELVYTPDPSIPSPAPLPTPRALSPLNRQDVYSIVEWTQHALESNDPLIVAELMGTSEEIGYGVIPEGGQLKTRDQFLADLAERLPSAPQCEGFVDSSGYNQIVIWTSGWSPLWEITEFCYEGCRVPDSPITADSLGLAFRMTTEGWVLGSIWFSDYADYAKNWAPLGEPLMQACDEVPVPAERTAVPQPTASFRVCPGSPPIRLRVGQYAFVSVDQPLPNRLRSAAGTDQRLIAELAPGTVMEVIGGPACADTLTWWNVRAIETRQEGWTVEGDYQSYWLVPCATVEECGKP